MSKQDRRTEAMNTSFLPEDYLERKADRRMGLIAMVLFTVVMFGVVGAFFVTIRQRSEVTREQTAINAEYAEEAKKIEQLKVLEAQKQEMLEKAEITTALIERVPRSILMAELINRMPDQLTLTDLKLTGKRINQTPPPAPKRATPQPRSLARRGGPGAADAPEEELPKPRPPKFDFKLELIGLAATDNDVADYQASLQICELLRSVDLLYSGHVIVDEIGMRKFRIEAEIEPMADARHIEPLTRPRLPTRPSTLIGHETDAVTDASIDRSKP